MTSTHVRNRSATRRRKLWLPGLSIALIGTVGLVIWSQKRERAPVNVLLITIDTLRADALGSYGNRNAATPVLDRLAAGGLRFDNARAHNVVTLPSHANILTGRLPVDHGVRDNSGFRLPPGEETLATWLGARGYRTAAFVSAFPLDSRFGLARAFDEYDDRFVDATARPAMLEQERPAPKTLDAARRWLAAQGTTPWFCWVHLYEPHFPYAPTGVFAARFDNSPYAGEVAAVDAALGPLLQPILDAGRGTDTLVVVTSDHGEALGEHGESTHGIFAYEGTLKVPLIVYFPALLQPRTVTAPAAHVDIAPTILDALRLPIPPAIRGRSLLDDEDTAARVTYFEALSGLLNRDWAPLTGVTAGGLKYIDLPIPELYDLEHDPHEQHNLTSARPADVEKLRALLKAVPSATITPTEESEETKSRLRSLGYVAAAGTAHTPRTYNEDDDPKRLIQVEHRLQQAVDGYLAGNIADALSTARALASEHPTMRVALLQLAQLEREAGNLTGAIAALQRAVQLNPRDTEAASLLGAYLTSANRPQDALKLLEPHADARDPDVQVLRTLALAQARANRVGDALSTLRRAREQDPSNAMLLVEVGTVHLIGGNRGEARVAFEQAIAANPGAARAHRSLAVMEMEDGRPEQALQHWRAAVAADPGEYDNLLTMAIALAHSARSPEALPYMRFFAENAPRSRYAADIERAHAWIAGRR